MKYFKDMAAQIKRKVEEDDKDSKGTSGWHVIVGKFISRKSFKNNYFYNQSAY